MIKDSDISRFGGFLTDSDLPEHKVIVIPMKSNMDTRITDIGSTLVRNRDRITYGLIKLQHIDNYMVIDREKNIFDMHIVCLERK